MRILSHSFSVARKSWTLWTSQVSTIDSSSKNTDKLAVGSCNYWLDRSTLYVRVCLTWKSQFARLKNWCESSDNDTYHRSLIHESQANTILTTLRRVQCYQDIAPFDLLGDRNDNCWFPHVQYLPSILCHLDFTDCHLEFEGDKNASFSFIYSLSAIPNYSEGCVWHLLNNPYHTPN